MTVESEQLNHELQKQLYEAKHGKSMEIKPAIAQEHILKAIEICKANIIPGFKKAAKKGNPCCHCGGTGNVGLNTDGLLKPCRACVQTSKVWKEWIEYCKDVPELKKKFIDEFKGDIPAAGDGDGQ